MVLPTIYTKEAQERLFTMLSFCILDMIEPTSSRMINAPMAMLIVQKNGAVNGFITMLPIMEAALFAFIRCDRAIAKSAPRPNVGNIPMKTPIAAPLAITSGESFIRSILR